MLKVEASLAMAQSKVGIMPESAANIIAECAQSRFIDLELLKSEIPLGGNAAIPLVNQLIRIVKNNDFEASKYVHLGATSQDIVDSALVLCISEYQEWLEGQLGKLMTELADLARHHRETVMIGRTLLQHARPITFGLKVAGWLQGLMDCQQRLIESKSRVLQLQLSGAVGAGNHYLSEEVRSEFSRELGLSIGSSWQSGRGNLVEWASALGILSGQLGKIARDISLLMQTEVSEVFEGSEKGKGGSSTMPHKRNPVTCSILIANGERIPHLVSSIMATMMQEHERSAGMWHAEWEVITDIMRLTGGSLEKSVGLIAKLEVDPNRMSKNMDLTNGLIFAESVFLELSSRIGKLTAHEWVEKCCKQAVKENKHLRQVLEASEHRDLDFDRLFDPANSIGNSLEMTDKILKNYETQL